MTDEPRCICGIWSGQWVNQGSWPCQVHPPAFPYDTHAAVDYYINHSALTAWGRWLAPVEGAAVGGGAVLCFIWLVVGLCVLGAGLAFLAAHLIADSDAMCSRRFERRRIAKIEADRAAGVRRNQ